MFTVRDHIDDAAAYVGAVLRVVQAVAAFGLPGSSLRLPETPLSDPSWQELVEVASSERLLGLLFAATDSGRFPLRPEQAERLQDLATDSLRYCMLLESELIQVTNLLEKVGVRTRVLKGPATAALDYPDRAWRPFIDIDLLVHPDEFDLAVATLVGSGYQREFPQPRRGFDRRFSKGASFVAPSGTQLDLHRTFAMGPFGLTVHIDDLWAAGTSFSLGPCRLQALSAEGRLLQACYHAALGDWPRRLLPHRDIAQLMLAAPCDEDRVFEVAERWAAEAVLATAVSNAWQLLDIAHDTELSAWAKRYVPSAGDQRALSLYARPDANYAAMSWGALRVIHGVRNKAAFLLALVFPDRSYLTDRHATRFSRITRGVRQVVDVRRSRT